MLAFVTWFCVIFFGVPDEPRALPQVWLILVTLCAVIVPLPNSCIFLLIVGF